MQSFSYLLYKCPEEHRFQAAGNERKKARIIIQRMKERKQEKEKERKKERNKRERKKNPGKLPGRSTTSILYTWGSQFVSTISINISTKINLNQKISTEKKKS
jgi:hypothetical protein